MSELASAGHTHCSNCGAALQGPYCHECGQSVHSVLQPVHGVLEDAMDIALHVDGRIMHTLPALYLRPGFLTREYFAGRRVRYVAPFRLMFVLCLLAFFAFHVVLDRVSEKAMSRTTAEAGQADGFAGDDSPKEVRDDLADQLEGLASARRAAVLPQAAIEQLDVAERSLREQASRRLVALGAAPMPAASLAPPPVPAATAALPPAAEPKPGTGARSDQGVRLAWLPDFVNARLILLGQHIKANWQAVKHGDEASRRETRERIIAGFFGVLPQAMVVMIPVFAALLKLFYLFRRRLYMEHLIAALHSHAFLFLSLLLVAVTGMLSTWLKPHANWTGYALGLVQAAVLLWMPAYLLIMQKRVYGQGWPMTVLKFWFVGWFYLWLLLFVLVAAAVSGMAH